MNDDTKKAKEFMIPDDQAGKLNAQYGLTPSAPEPAKAGTKEGAERVSNWKIAISDDGISILDHNGMTVFVGGGLHGVVVHLAMALQRERGVWAEIDTAAQPTPCDVQGEGIADAAFLRSEAEDILGRMQTEENHMLIDPRRRSDLIRRAARLRSIADALLSAWKERDELRALLVDWLSHHDDPCRLDHHGYCQSHYLETDCIVKRTAAALAAKDAAK